MINKLLIIFIFTINIPYITQAVNKSHLRSSAKLDKVVSIATIYSYFNDSKSGNENELHLKSVNGTLFLFKFFDSKNNKERIFGLTTSHVTQGSSHLLISKNLDIGNQIIGRLANNEDDIEIFEFRNDSSHNLDINVLGEWDEKRSLIRVSRDSLDSWLQEKVEKVSENLQTKRELISLVYDENNNPYEYFVPKGEWVTSQSNTGVNQVIELMTVFPFGNSKQERKKLSFLPIENEFYSPSQIIRGMSGSPLISNNAPIDFNFDGKITLQDINSASYSSNDLFILGIAKSLDSSMSGSWYVTYKSIQKLFELYLKKNSGVISPTTWKMKYGFTYRDFGDGNAENFPASLERFYKTKVPTGGPGIVDGGGPGIVDGGGPVAVAGSREILAKSSTHSMDSLLGLSEFLPGVQYQYHPILGFRLINGMGLYVESNPKRVINYFNDVIDHRNLQINLNSSLFEYFQAKYTSFIKMNQNLLEEDLNYLNKNELSYNLSLEYFAFKNIFKQCESSPNRCTSKNLNQATKLGAMPHSEFIDYNKKHIEEIIYNRNPKVLERLESIRNSKTKKSIEIKSEMLNSTLESSEIKVKINSNQFHFYLVGPSPENIHIEFILDQYGRLIENNKPKTSYFNPIIIVAAKENPSNLFIIDLRSFFFANTLFYQDYYENPVITEVPDLPRLSKNSFQRLLIEGPVIRLRSFKSPQIYEIQFNTPNLN